MNKFEAFGLREEVLRAITEMGFSEPTDVQARTLPVLLNKENEQSGDVLVLAQTGTGKTAAFGLPLMHLVDTDQDYPQALVLSPTRELCLQITNDFEKFSKYSKGIKAVAVYGGASIQTQLKSIQAGVQIIVATPGRLVDILGRKKGLLKGIKTLVLDEADEMLNMGFKDELDTILETTPSDKSTWLFSATMPSEVARIASEYMHNPLEIAGNTKNKTNANIEHVYLLVHSKDKYAALKRLADYYPGIFAIVFCRTKIETQQVADMLIKDGYNADALHGDLSQAQREHVMKRYRSRNLQMLVATDVAARGIDVNDVTHVINYQLPDEPEVYTHRSGRTARAGKKGICISIISKKDIGKVKLIEKISSAKMQKIEVPGAKEVCEKQLLHFVHKLHEAEVDEKEIAPYMDNVYNELVDLSKEELIKRFVSIEFNRFLDYYRTAKDLNQNVDSDTSGRQGIKCFLTLGRLDGFDKDSLKKFVSKTASIEVADVVWVDLKNSYSFVEIEPEKIDQTLEAFKNASYKGRRATLEIRDKSGSGKEGRSSSKGGYSKDRDSSRSGYSRNGDRSRPRGESDKRGSKGSRVQDRTEDVSKGKKYAYEEKAPKGFKLEPALQELFAQDDFHSKGKSAKGKKK